MTTAHTPAPTAEWATLRPRFERMVFRAGYHEIHRLTLLSVSTIYRLANGEADPRPRTMRDIAAAVDAWEQGWPD